MWTVSVSLSDCLAHSSIVLLVGGQSMVSPTFKSKSLLLLPSLPKHGHPSGQVLKMYSERDFIFYRKWTFKTEIRVDFTGQSYKRKTVLWPLGMKQILSWFWISFVLLKKHGSIFYALHHLFDLTDSGQVLQIDGPPQKLCSALTQNPAHVRYRIFYIFVVHPSHWSAFNKDGALL